MNIFLFVLLLMFILNFYFIVKEVFKNFKWVYVFEYFFKFKKFEIFFIVLSFLLYS